MKAQKCLLVFVYVILGAASFSSFFLWGLLPIMPPAMSDAEKQFLLQGFAMFGGLLGCITGTLLLILFKKESENENKS